MPHEIIYDGFPVKNPKMIHVFNEVADYARQGYPVVLFGPSGSGKEFLAQYYYDIYINQCNEKGRFETVNCATLADGTAAGDLFGYVKGIFSEAYKDKEGLLEILKTGVLFLDEVGDLSENIQAMLLRALHTNPTKREGRRIGAVNSYKIDQRLCIVCATDKPVDSIRESLLFRMGAIIHVPGMDEREEDIKSALLWFFKKSLYSLRDYNQLVSGLEKSSTQKNLKNWDDFSLAVSSHLLPLVESKKWKGNFRSLNTVVNQSVIRSANSNTFDQLFNNTIRFFQEILPNYTSSVSNTEHSLVNHAESESLKKQDEINSKLEKILQIFPRIKNDESVKIAEFLVAYSSIAFKRSDFESFISSSYTPRTAQKRLRDLVSNNIIAIEDNGLYRVKAEEIAGEEFICPDSFALPVENYTDEIRLKLVEGVLPLINNSKGIYLSTEEQISRGSISSCLGDLLKQTYPVYYFSFDNQDISMLIEAAKTETERNSPSLFSQEIWDKTDDQAIKIAFLSGYFDRYANENRSPVLILESVNKLVSGEDKMALLAVIKFWPFFRFVLIGDKMGNEFEGFTEVKVN